MSTRARGKTDGPIFTITYWGTTGSFPVPLQPAGILDKVVGAVEHLVRHRQLADLQPGPGLRAAVRERVLSCLPFHLRSSFGGNTTCVEVQTPDALLILDCGSGARELGLCLEQRWNAPAYQGPRTAHVLLTHAHLDHLLGSPFFAPYFDARNEFILWGTPKVLDTLASFLKAHYPTMYSKMTAIRGRRPIEAGREFRIGATHIRTYALNHPGGCLAYRLENAGRSFVFVTDHEQPEVPDRGLADFARGADLLYLEGQFLDQEYAGDVRVPGEGGQPRRGWGHSTISGCVETAVRAQARCLHVGHRDPLRRDDELVALERHYQRRMREALRRAGRKANECRFALAGEGMTVHV
ncbi:MAG TPA: MBL fold metallo-hydrolase [Gemmataceae bacterium]|nr:MBL fold metallo-hydrolase [Gemmataceae bacterium]